MRTQDQSLSVVPAADQVETAPVSRRRVIQEASQRAGAAWAQGWFDLLQREGRLVTGGWPGTMSEAKGRARAQVDSSLTRLALPPVTHEELNDAARVAYDNAKSLWLGRRVREEGLP
ncbi:MAG: hypothetical protein AAGA56_07320 [Myxococcota bacterium]